MIQKGENRGIVIFRVIVLHLSMIGIFFIPPNQSLILLFIASYLIRAFGIEVGHHRYFAHNAFKTSRPFQFILALLGASAGFRGPLWWADVHRKHHRHSDTPKDPHSPSDSFLHAHILWIFKPENQNTDLNKAGKFSRYKELVILNKYHYLVP